MALTASAALVRKYCRPIKDETTAFTDGILDTWWDTAHAELKSELCPPFVEADFDLLNTESGDHTFANALIAQFAAMLIYRTLPGKSTTEEDKLQIYFYGQAETGKVGILEKLGSGENSLFKADGSRLTRTAAARISDEDVARVFSRTQYDADGNVIGTVGALDQFDR